MQLENLVRRQITACEVIADSIRYALPYADGPAYYEDKQKLDAIEREAHAWRHVLRIVEAAAPQGRAL